MKRPSTGQNIALSVTVVVAILLLILLMGCRLTLPEKKPVKPSEAITMAELEEEEPQEQFIEPVLQDAGEPEQAQDMSSEPIPQGEPEQAPVENKKLVVKDENPEPNKSVEKLVSTKTASTAKTTPPSKKEESESRISSTMKNQFSSTNGSKNGNAPTASSGNAGKASGVSGTMGNGRKLESWTLPVVSPRQPATVKVTVMVRADGTVESAVVQPGSADPSLKETCRKYSLRTRWTPKEGAPLARGTLTWNIIPKL